MARLLTLFITLFSFQAFAAPKSELWPFWNQANPNSTETISHQTWQSFLDNYLVQDGDYTLVKYGAVSSADKQALKAYINGLAQLDPRTYNQAEQYAYWVNLYNAITVDLILDAYPIESITKLGGFFSFGPWGKDIIDIQGQTLTLNDIEHRILRPIWQDPRTHYAVNCASLGCPNLQGQAFTANNIEALLEQAAKDFVNSDKGVLVESNQVQLSSIYDWFVADFGTQQQLLEHINQYRTQPVSSLNKVNYEYDWSLNKK